MEGMERREMGIIAEQFERMSAPTTQNFSFFPDDNVLASNPCMVRGMDGVEYFDAHSGPGVFNLGHNHPKIEHVKRTANFGFGANEYPNPYAAKLAKKLASISPGEFDKKFFFCSSGAEAVEAAIRAVQIKRRTPVIMAFERAFHGRTYGARTLTDRKHVSKYSYPAFPVIRLPFPEAGTEMGESEIFMKNVKRRLATVNLDEVAALFWEPIQGEGGIRVTGHDAFKALYEEIIRPNGILLVDDEVQTFSRTGKWFATEHYGVEPDIICVAKALGNGAPIGATIMRSDVCWPEGGLYSNTWGGNPFCCAIALKTLEIMEGDDLIPKAEHLGRELRERLRGCLTNLWIEAEIDIDGLGLMCKIEFFDPFSKEELSHLRDKIVGEAFKRGILLMRAGDSAIRIMPPLVVTEEQIEWLARELAGLILAATSQ